MVVQDLNIHPLLRLVITRIIDNGLGEIIMSPDGHFFFQPDYDKFECIHGAMEFPEEREKYGMHVTIRHRRTNVKTTKYEGYPPYIIYLQPIIRKTAETMTDAERRNIEIHTEATDRAHAIMANPEQRAQYQQLHTAHIREHELHPNRPPQGYKKFYPNLFGFLVATLHAQLAAQAAARESLSRIAAPTEAAAQQPAQAASPAEIPAPQECSVLAIFNGEYKSGIRLFVPRIRLPSAA